MGIVVVGGEMEGIVDYPLFDVVVGCLGVDFLSLCLVSHQLNERVKKAHGCSICCKMCVEVTLCSPLLIDGIDWCSIYRVLRSGIYRVNSGDCSDLGWYAGRVGCLDMFRVLYVAAKDEEKFRVSSRALRSAMNNDRYTMVTGMMAGGYVPKGGSEWEYIDPQDIDFNFLVVYLEREGELLRELWEDGEALKRILKESREYLEYMMELYFCDTLNTQRVDWGQFSRFLDAFITYGEGQQMDVDFHGFVLDIVKEENVGYFRAVMEIMSQQEGTTYDGVRGLLEEVEGVVSKDTVIYQDIQRMKEGRTLTLG